MIIKEICRRKNNTKTFTGTGTNSQVNENTSFYINKLTSITTIHLLCFYILSYHINNLIISNGDSSVGIGECAGIMLSELLKKEPNVTAVIGVNDDLALGAMHWAIRSGIKIPDDLSIAGFDDNDFCRFVIPEMTSVSHPCREAGFRAAAAVATHIESNGKIPLPKEVLSTKLIPRYSTGQAKKIF